MPAEPERVVAQPLTFEGVAALARTSIWRLAGWQLAVALLAAASVASLVELAWAPVVKQAISALPPSGAIQYGKLSWTNSNPVRIAGSRFLWLSVDPADSLDRGEGADLQVELGARAMRWRSLFGYWSMPYPTGYLIALNRTELEPWWGAWHNAILLGACVSVIAGLLLAWVGLALLYAWPVRMIAFYADRTLSWAGAWKLAAAALLPGALFFSLAVAAYAFQRINLVQLIFAAALHVLIPWIYVLASPFCLPRALPTATVGKNPFHKPAPKSENPFAGQDKD